MCKGLKKCRRKSHRLVGLDEITNLIFCVFKRRAQLVQVLSVCGSVRMGKTSKGKYISRVLTIRTGRPDKSICKENSTISQNCQAISVYFYVACIAGTGF